MNTIKSVVAVFAVLSTLGATGCTSTDDVTTDEDDIGRATKVAGFDLAGPRIATGLGPRMACPQRANAVTDSCIAAGGTTTYTRTCDVLCSVPVAAEGRVAGFDFSGFRAAVDANGPEPACRLQIDAVSVACEAARGRTSAINSCNKLCSVPVAARGSVAGFDLTGYQTAEALPDGFACPQRANAVSDACIAKRGTTSYTRGCDVLCSTPIAR